MKSFLVALVVAVVKYVVDLLSPKSRDGQQPGRREERLKKQVKKDGWPGGRAGVLVLVVLMAVASCTPSSLRTIYVPPGKSVRLRETVRSAKVWVLDAHGMPQAGVMDLPEGWYALPDPEEDLDGID
jgi:hypothetical protein